MKKIYRGEMSERRRSRCVKGQVRKGQVRQQQYNRADSGSWNSPHRHKLSAPARWHASSPIYESFRLHCEFLALTALTRREARGHGGEGELRSMRRPRGTREGVKRGKKLDIKIRGI